MKHALLMLAALTTLSATPVLAETAPKPHEGM